MWSWYSDCLNVHFLSKIIAKVFLSAVHSQNQMMYCPFQLWTAQTIVSVVVCFGFNNDTLERVKLPFLLSSPRFHFYKCLCFALIGKFHHPYLSFDYPETVQIRMFYSSL